MKPLRLRLRVVRLRVVRSTMDPGLLSLRLEGKRPRAWTFLKEALTDAGYLPGDIVELTIVSRLGDRDTEVQS